MRSQHLWWIALTFFAAGCGSDTGLNIKNLDPEALITSHIDGDEVVEGEQVTFIGQATDVDNIDVTAAWYNGGLELCEAIPPDEYGLSICTGSVGAGDQIVTLEVRDPLNASARHSITVFGVANEAPVANLRSPSISGTYYANELVSFEATISDKEDVPEGLERHLSGE